MFGLVEVEATDSSNRRFVISKESIGKFEFQGWGKGGQEIWRMTLPAWNEEGA